MFCKDYIKCYKFSVFLTLKEGLHHPPEDMYGETFGEKWETKIPFFLKMTHFNMHCFHLIFKPNPWGKQCYPHLAGQ